METFVDSNNHKKYHKNNQESNDGGSSSNTNIELFNVSIQSGEEVILSSLPLQMSLYLNVIFVPFWCVIMVTMLHVKNDCLSSTYRFIEVLVLTSLILTECVRLYLGYLGNISEKIPELAGFWVLSLLLQLPLHLFVLLSTALHPLPIERVVESIMLLFLSVQLITGFGTLRKCALYQAQRYQLQFGGKVEQSPR